jgi:hypothetical protein
LNWEITPVNLESNLKRCRVLFISASERGNLVRILAKLEHGAVLTVGDSAGYAEEGVMVNFYLEESRVRFEINREAVGRAQLRISSQLLKLARLTGKSGDGR